jgi:hypothetical protein
MNNYNDVFAENGELSHDAYEERYAEFLRQKAWYEKYGSLDGYEKNSYINIV